VVGVLGDEVIVVWVVVLDYRVLFGSIFRPFVERLK